MKKVIITIALALCLTSHADAQSRSTKGSGTKTTAAAFSMSADKWSKKINLSQDLTKLNYQDLYYLRALVYASHGKWYTEGEIYKMLDVKTDWYPDIVTDNVNKYYEDCQKKNIDSSEEGVMQIAEGTPLTAAEQAFVDKIDARMAALKPSATDGTNLESPEVCVNLCQLDKPSADVINKLSKYNFAIEKTDCEQLFNIYEQNDYNMMPNFVTTDAYLQLSHMYLAYVQKYIEKKYFIPALGNTLNALYRKAMDKAANLSGAARERSLYVATYAAIGVKLLTDKQLTIPAEYQEIYNAEMENLKAENDLLSPFMGTQLNFTYSLFRPRGHYTRSEDMQRYFKAMMWVQTATFHSKNPEAMKRAAMLAMTYNALTPAEKKEFEGMGDIITQLTGESDNVSILQLAEYLRKNNITNPADIDNAQTFKAIIDELTRLNSQQNKLSNNAEALEGFNVNMMPQRFLVDNEVLRTMVDEKANAELPFPRGLDVFAAFGSEDAEKILTEDFDDDQKWDGFNKALALMKGKYANKPVGMGTIYDRRLQILVNLANRKTARTANYSFYNTSDWKKKELNTALASWATLKHDAILYAEQPAVAECGDGSELPKPLPVGFVEPNQEFWKELSSIISDTKTWLEKNNSLDDELSEKTDNLLSSVNYCKDIVAKELRGEALSYEEKQWLKGIGSSLEWMTLGLIDPDLELMSWSDVKGADRSVALVADVFTRNVLGCQKSGVLYTATGNANAIYVLVNIDGQTYLTRGAAYGYYEFVLPLDQPRLTDEEWQKELEKNRFDLPQWLQPYIIKGKVKVNEQNFYGSGC